MSKYKLQFCLLVIAALFSLSGCGGGGNSQANCTELCNSSTTPLPPITDNPAGFTATALSSRQVVLQWQPAVGSAVDGYAVMDEGGSVIKYVSEPNAIISGLSAVTTYRFTIQTVDSNRSPLGDAVSVGVNTLVESQSVLSGLAGSMQNGDWLAVETEGFDQGGILATPDNGSVTEYNNEAVWDPVNKRILIAGTARSSLANYGIEHQKWVQWSDIDNRWTHLPQLPFYLGFHSYDHIAVNPQTGDFYVRVVASQDVWKLSDADGQWQLMPALPISYASCCNALEFFPAMDQLLFSRGSSDGDTEIFRFDDNSNSWMRVAAGQSMPMGNFHDFAAYSSVNEVMYIGGGQVYEVGGRNEVYAIDANGGVTQLAGAPFNFDVANTITVADPISGNLLLFYGGDPDNYYEHRYDSDSWVQCAMTGDFRIQGTYDNKTTLAAVVPEHQVIMFFKHDYDNSSVYLFKHDSCDVNNANCHCQAI